MKFEEQLQKAMRTVLCPEKKDQEKPKTSIKTIKTMEELIKEINSAKENKSRVRCVGSKHSPPQNIYPTDGVTIELDGEDFLSIEKMNENIWKTKSSWRVGAGVHLGYDPRVPSSKDHNLSKALSEAGYALALTGGITHQTVGGYLSTGADGGSVQHGCHDNIGDIEFVDGKCVQHVAKMGTDVWRAVGVSMGMFGIITHVWLHVTKIYKVEGEESTVDFNESLLRWKDGEHTVSFLQQNLQDPNNEYIRLNWFPQRKVGKVKQYHAKRIPFSSSKPTVPYQSDFSSPMVAKAASFVLCAGNEILQDVKKMPENVQDAAFDFVDHLLNCFVPVTEPKVFRDVWWKALPMDNPNYTETSFKTDFTELWIPIAECDRVMKLLTDMFAENEEAAGSFAIEIYCAKQSPFWLSMACGGDVVRVDVYWHHANCGDPRDFFGYYWDVLLGVPGARLHWGKYLPITGTKYGRVDEEVTFDVEFLKKSYPMLEEWMKLRREFDPDQLFLSDYWRGIFEIPK